MTARRVHLLLAALLLAAVPACRGGAGKPTSRSTIPRTYVSITNQAWLDMTVYVIQGAQRVRIGSVNSNSTARLALPQGMISGITTISFLVDPIGSNRTASSFQITVSPGEEVKLTIPATVR